MSQNRKRKRKPDKAPQEHEERVRLEDSEILHKAMVGIRLLRAYHRHRVVGLSFVPTSGPALLVCNHSLATYDLVLLFGAIFEGKKRVCRSLADHLFFKIPYLGELVEKLGVAEGTRENARTLLSAGELVGVAPGGMKEGLKPSSERYRLFWEERQGFARMSMETQAPVILAMCPKADDIFQVYENALTRLCYTAFRIPVPLVRGLGLTLLPRPVQLTHYLSRPILPPPLRRGRVHEADLKAFHQELMDQAEKLMARGLLKSK